MAQIGNFEIILQIHEINICMYTPCPLQFECALNPSSAKDLHLWSMHICKMNI